MCLYSNGFTDCTKLLSPNQTEIHQPKAQELNELRNKISMVEEAYKKETVFEGNDYI